MTLCPSGGDPPHSLHCHYSSFNTYMRRFRRFCSGSLALASLDLPAGIIVPTSPRRSPPRLLPQQLAVAWDQRPDRRTRRALLHLSYSSAPPFGPVMLVTQDPFRTFGPAYQIESCATGGLTSMPLRLRHVDVVLSRHKPVYRCSRRGLRAILPDTIEVEMGPLRLK